MGARKILLQPVDHGGASHVEPFPYRIGCRADPSCMDEESWAVTSIRITDMRCAIHARHDCG